MAPPLIVDLDAPCPCGGGRIASECCILPDRSIRSRNIGTVPSDPVTGRAHPGCYARSLNDCCPTISGEHIVSHSILKVMGSRSDGVIEIGGSYPFLNGTTRELRAGSFKANVLCRRHNSALTGIDTVGEWLIGRPNLPVRIFNGPAVERWMLKVLLGNVAAGTWALRDGEKPSKEVPSDWVRVLFGRDTFQAGAGLFVTGNEGGTVNTPDIWLRLESYGIWNKDDGLLSGILIRTDIHAFVLSIEPQGKFPVLDGTWFHRPTRLVYSKKAGAVLRDMYFDWGPGVPHTVLEYEVSEGEG